MTEQENYIQDKTFDKTDLPTKGEYEICTFKSCDFSDKAFLNLSSLTARLIVAIWQKTYYKFS